MTLRYSWQVLACGVLAAALGCSHSSPGASNIPTISSFSPAKGKTGSSVVLKGYGFNGVTTVSVGGAYASFSIQGDNQLTLTVPDNGMSGVIGVVNALGTGGTATSFYVVPTLTSFTPATGAPGTVVTLTGTGFAGATGVTFGSGPAANYYVNSAQQAQAVVPYGSTSGSITITASDGDLATLTGFTYTGGAAVPPQIATAPTQGTTGTTVTLTGAGFTGVSAVKFGGVNAYFSVVDDADLTAMVPLNAVSGFIEVDSFLGPATSPAAFVVTPTITDFSPASGGTGTLVTLKGTGMVGTTSVAFGNAVTSNFMVIDANTVQANVAPGSATGPVTLVSNGVSCASAQAFTYVPDATAAPVITGVTDGTLNPPSAIAAGGTLTLTGTGFTGATSVAVGGVPAASFTVTGDTAIAFTVPGAAANGFISVANALGVAASPTSFVITPTVTGLSVTQGAANAKVTLTGTGFKGATSVTFGGNVTASFVVVDANTITTQVPAGAATGPITVAASGLTAQSGTFTVQ